MARAGFKKENNNMTPKRQSESIGGNITMKVIMTPGQELALTNYAYCSKLDILKFIGSNETFGMALIGGCMILNIVSHENVLDGQLALNAVQRRNAKVSAGDSILVMKFVPPEKGFDLLLLTINIEFVKARGKSEQIDAILLAAELHRRFSGQVFTISQRVSFDYMGTNYTFAVIHTHVNENHEDEPSIHGLLVPSTIIVFETHTNSGIKIINQKGAPSTMFKSNDVNFLRLGIGGLDTEFQDIFRRAFASRVFPPHIIQKLGIVHVKGLLLFGPPGTGKTLIARQIGKMLNGREPKVVNGPEVLNKFVGETEKNIRDLFADAEADQKNFGDQSELHIIILDELDAICKARGSTKDGTGVHDGIVNQLLTKIDGVEALNNILLIGMTNRKDLLDEALLRPGRLEVQIEIGLPNEMGRVQILNIHSTKMKENSFLDSNVNIEELALQTKNFSGAELEGLVKSAVSFALHRQINVDDLSKPLNDENIKVTMEDFLCALKEVKPAFGASVNSLEMCRLNGMLNCGEKHTRIRLTGMTLAQQVQKSERTPLLTCLLEGPSGSGKTALAATISIESGFPFIKIISAETMIGLMEINKCALISKVFEDAYKSPLSIIIMDDIERIIEYVHIGPRFSNLILQTILVLLKRIPPKGKKLLIIGTTSISHIMQPLGLTYAFNVILSVPNLKQENIKMVLEELEAFKDIDLPLAIEALDNEVSIKKLLLLLDMAKHGKDSEDVKATSTQTKTIEMSYFIECLRDLS